LEPSLVAVSVRSDVISSVKILSFSYLDAEERRPRHQALHTPPAVPWTLSYVPYVRDSGTDPCVRSQHLTLFGRGTPTLPGSPHRACHANRLRALPCQQVMSPSTMPTGYEPFDHANRLRALRPTRPHAMDAVMRQHRCRAHVAHIRQSRPDSGIDCLIQDSHGRIMACHGSDAESVATRTWCGRS